MTTHDALPRRSFLAWLGVTPFLAALRAGKNVPIGLELYSVRNELKKDLLQTVRNVARMGYECVEFFGPYYDWTLNYAQQVRKEIDALGVRCYSTHNSMQSFTPDGINKAIELNQVLGSRYIILAGAGKVSDADGWKRVAETLNKANDTMASRGLHAGYHNHAVEWKPLDGTNGQKPIELLAANTNRSIALQLDAGTCVETGNDPVAWVEKNPGRIRSMHLKDWSPAKGYKLIFGEGTVPWKELLRAAEFKGGVEYFLIEQEGSDYPEMETAQRCLAAYRKLRV